MGMHFRRIMNWPRGRKVAVTVLMTLTLAVGIVIGSVVADRVAATPQGDANAALLAVPGPGPFLNTVCAITQGGEETERPRVG